MSDLSPYRWAKIKDGIGAVAIVSLSVQSNKSNQNKIHEHYSGKGFIGQGNIEEISKKGYESWKIAARKGLEFAFSQIDTFWTVNIFKIEGRAYTDTNPTVVGYTVMRAFFDKINFQLDHEKTDRLEDFVMSSWTKPCKELIPDFSCMEFVEYNI